MIEGKIELKEDKFWITKPSGSRIAFPISKIEVTCDTVQEVYWSRYASLSPSDSNGHVRLMKWCLQKKLLKEAGNQIEILQHLDIKPNQQLQLNQQLLALMETRIQELSAPRTTKQNDKTPQTIKAVDDRDDIDTMVRPVNYESFIVERERIAIERAQHKKLLQSTMKSLPERAVVTFKRKIEPLLIHSCYTAKCHDGNSSSFNFRTLSKNSPIPKQMSQENLFQVMKFADFNQPLQSKLLKAAGLPHAGQDEPILKVETQQFQLLGAWLIAVSSQPTHFHPVPNTFLESDLKVETKKEDSASKTVQAMPKKLTAANDFAPMPYGKQTPEPQQSVDRKDPFDPEVFNRNFLNKK